MATTRRSAARHRAPIRWAIIALSCLATAGAYQAIVEGPAPAHAAPQVQTVVQTAPTLDEMISQIQAQMSDDGGGMAGPGAGPTFRSRGS